MIRYGIFSLALILLAGLSPAQSIVLNGGFEGFSSCPVANGEIGKASAWQDGILSSDYMNCAFSGWAPQIGGPFEGTAWAGGATYGDATGAAEAFGQTTSVPMISGQAYTYRMYAKMASTGVYSTPCGGVCMYGRMTPPAPTLGVHPENVAGTIFLGCTPTVSNTTWAVFQGGFTPTQNFTFFWLTPGTAATSSNCFQYIYIDSVSLQPGLFLNQKAIRFLAEEQEKGILVNWSVPDEGDLIKYEVERMVNDGEFEVIFSNAANGSSEYLFNDGFRSAELTSFYRISMIHSDGSHEYSPVLSVEPKITEQFTAGVHPNPFSGSGELKLDLPFAGRVSLQVYNSSGKLVLEKFDYLDAGKNALQLNMVEEVPGIYFLRAICRNEIVESKFILGN